VDAAKGNDSTATGEAIAPYKTITQALQHAAAGTVVQLAPGTYDDNSGERFPLTLPAGVTLQGDAATRGEGYLIEGDGAFISPTMAHQSVAILAESGSEIRGVTLQNLGRRGYAVWLESTSPRIVSNTFTLSIHDGIFMVGNAAPHIEGNRFFRNGANGISILGTATPKIINNDFEETGYGVMVSKQAAPSIENNRIQRNRSGVVVTDEARPVLRGNTISDNLEDGLVAIANAQPDLGSSQGPGNNQFSNNGKSNIHNATAGLNLAAQGNQFDDPSHIQGTVNTDGALTASATPTETTDSPVASVAATPTATAAPLSPTSSSPAEVAPAPPTSPSAPAATPAPPSPTAVAVTAAPEASTPSPNSASEFKAVPFLPAPEEETTAATAPPSATASEPSAPSTSAAPSGTTPPAAAPSSTPSTSPAPATISPTGAVVSAGTTVPAPNDSAQTSPTPTDSVTPEPITPEPTSAAVVSTDSVPSTEGGGGGEGNIPPAVPSTDDIVAAAITPAEPSNRQFRVWISPRPSDNLNRVRTIAPDAQTAQVNGRQVYVVGHYRSRQEVRAILDKLTQAGYFAVADTVPDMVGQKS
jgi:parallel beta-helix repeat protein